MYDRFYRVYDLTLSSERDLPFPSVDRTPDPNVRVEFVDPYRPDVPGPDEVDGATRVVEREGKTIVSLQYDEFGSIAVDRDRIRVAPRPDVDAKTLVGYVLGVGMGTLLWVRGLLVLHASAVRVGNRVVGFLGDTGTGKSTTAAAFVDRGARVVTDDLLAVTPGDPTTVAPGPPLLKLDREVAAVVESAQAVELDGRVLGATDDWGFYRFPGVGESPVALDALYVLSDDSEIGVEQLSPRDAAFALVRNTYAFRLLDTADCRERNLQECTAVADRVPVGRLARPSDLDALDDLVETVRSDLE